MLSAPTILKLGGSLITDKRGDTAFAPASMHRLARELAASRAPLVVLHGTGSFGKPPARTYGYLDGHLPRNRVGVVAHVDGLLAELRAHVLSALRAADLPALGLDPIAVFRHRRGALEVRDLGALEAVLERGAVPVLSGGFLDDEDGFAVGSSDAMAACLAIALGAPRLWFATDAPGVVGEDGAPIGELRDCDRAAAQAVRADDGDVSGAMAGKLRAGFEAARAGVETAVIDGRVDGRVADALAGRLVPCTRLRVRMDT
jgi:glutamate 5-kinase